MPKFKISIVQIDGHPDGVTAPQETCVYSQTFSDIDPTSLIHELNRPKRKKRTAKQSEA